MPMGHSALLLAGATPANTRRPLMKVSSRRGRLASSTRRPAFSRALRSGTSNLRQKVDNSLPSLLSSTSSHRLPNTGKSASCASSTLMRSLSGSSI
ncbi:hypothetical protein D3C81_1878570 [compost metagenome]